MGAGEFRRPARPRENGGPAARRADQRAAVPVARGIAVQAVDRPQEVERRGHAEVVEDDARRESLVVSNPAIRCDSAQVANTALMATPDSDQPSSSGCRASCVAGREVADERVVGEQDQVREQRAQVDVHRHGVAQRLPQRRAGGRGHQPRQRGERAAVADQPVAAAAERGLEAQRRRRRRPGERRAPARRASARARARRAPRWRQAWIRWCGPHVKAIAANATPKCEKPRLRRWRSSS